MSDAYRNATLPSQGIWYGGKIPGGVVEIRANTVREDLALDTDSMKVSERLSRLVKACTKFPDPKFTTNDLLFADMMALALGIRSVTYGTKWNFTFTCRKCEVDNPTSVDFASGEVEERTPETIQEEWLAEKLRDPEATPIDLTEPFHLALPESKHNVAFRHLRLSDDATIEKRTKSDLLVKGLQQSMVGIDLSPMVQMSQRLVSVDDNEIPNSQKDAFILALSGGDYRAIKKFLTRFEVGIKLSVTRTCLSCATEQKVGVPLSLQTFRGDSDQDA